MAVTLHRCSTRWKFGPCWRVQKALDEQGIDYEIVKGPARPGKRTDLQRISGQKLYPVLEDEFADKHDMIRVVDESGEDYLYPSSYFVRVELPQAVEQTLRKIA